MKNSNSERSKSISTRKITRRKFFELGSVGVVAVAVAGITGEVSAAEKVLRGKELAMVIDLQRCTGCGACTIACKNENNVQEGFVWAYRIKKTSGRFPNVKYSYMPTLCNHCRKAPCVRICPTTAMHKTDGGITAHDPNKCIGCKSCISACPYVVISRNNKETHRFWKGGKSLIEGCTESAREVTKKAKGKTIPYYNPDREKNLKGSGLRYKGIVEKCTFCDHRLKKGKLPYCVERCPAEARVFGDLNNPDSKVNEILGKYRSVRLREHLGTEPKVFYVRDFNPGTYRKGRGRI